MKMKKYEARIEEAGIDCLKRLIGNESMKIYSPGIDVEKKYILASKYVFLLEKGSFLEIESQWLETKEYLDYWKLHVNVTDKPKGIPIKNDKNFGKIFTYPISTIYIGKVSPIIKILILEDSQQNDSCQESVLYDKSIIFYRQDKFSFSISAHNSIADLLEYTDNKRFINTSIEKLHCRYVID